MNEIKHVVETLDYVKRFSGLKILIKLGGSILEDMNRVKHLCEDLSLLKAAGIDIIIVHGGSKAINQELEHRKITSEFHEGQRITTIEMIECIEMVLCGHVQKNIVRTLNTMGVNAIGLTGSDNNMLLCSRVSEKLGEVGQIDKVDVSLLEQCFSTSQTMPGVIPVISPIGVDSQGNALNINADWAASAIAKALNIHKLIYLTDQDGIYDGTGELLSELDAGQLKELIDQGIVEDGMLTKVKTIISALQQGISHIHILNAKYRHVLLAELFTDEGVGTICRSRF